MFTSDQLVVHMATETDVREFVTWEYEAPYDVYNTGNDDETVAYMLRPEVQCHTVWFEDELIAFCTFGQDAHVPGGDYSTDALDIGLGVRPALTGRGLGGVVVGAVLEFARRRFDAGGMRVTIASRNLRAISVWVGAGFVLTSSFSTERSILGSNEWQIYERVPVDELTPSLDT